MKTKDIFKTSSRRLHQDECLLGCCSTKVFGLNWDTTSDKFIFNFDDIFSTAVNLPATKRNILKISSTFFDSLGIIIPITLPAKVLDKDICLEKYSWDSQIRCNYIQKRWLGYLNELDTLSKVSVNRHVLCCDCRIVDIHEFCDKAGKAYCAIFFAKVSCSHGVSVNFWMEKSRLAPMKKLSVSRLELLACLLLSELVISVVDAVKSEVRIKEICCWSDSQIAIWWIKQCGKVWNVWINNRVEKIREMVPPSRWFFVPTGLNPADVGLHPVSLENIDLDFWLKGPQFLLSDCKDWSSETFLLSEKEAKLEERVVKTWIFSVVIESKGIGEVLDCSKFYSLDKLLRITSYLVRFIFNVQSRKTLTIIEVVTYLQRKDLLVKSIG